ncbi:hypothetical protein D915_010778, partial [Fasciola hepatica]
MQNGFFKSEMQSCLTDRWVEAKRSPLSKPVDGQHLVLTTMLLEKTLQRIKTERNSLRSKNLHLMDVAVEYLAFLSTVGEVIAFHWAAITHLSWAAPSPKDAAPSTFRLLHWVHRIEDW